MASLFFVASVVALVLFYLLIVIVGVVASWVFRKRYGKDVSEVDLQMVAGRKIGSIVGWLTMSATLVGGGFLNGTAESVASNGLIWTQAPFGICLGLIIGGIVFAPRMRAAEYTTMLDPLQQKYGSIVTGALYLTTLFGDVLWSGAILAALGTSLSVMVGLNVMISVIISAAVAVFYTLIGQMISVAYTDIAELVMIVLGTVLVTPFAISNEAVPSLLHPNSTQLWTGQLDTNFIPMWVDLAITMTLGSIPWQSYFQRVLSVEKVSDARNLSILAGGSALLLAVPPILLGIVGATAEKPQDVIWDKSLTLPLVIKFLTPVPVAVLGLAAISAAVMSSADSAILGSASMFTHNIYAKLRPKASVREISIVLKVAIVLIGALSTLVALITPDFTIYGLFILAADIVFAGILPQLTCSLFVPFANGYGAICGYLLSLIMRLGAGEPMIGMPHLFKYPMYDEELEMQMFPFRTLTVLMSIAATVIVSKLAQVILWRYTRLDILGLIQRRDTSEEEFTELEKVNPTQ